MILRFHWSGTSRGCGLEDPESLASLPPCPKSPGHWSYGSSETCLDDDDDDHDDQFRVPRPPLGASLPSQEGTVPNLCLQSSVNAQV